MQSPDNAELAAAAKSVIEGRERSIRARVLVDWNGSDNFDHPLSLLDQWIESVSTERALKGSAPEEILLVEGSSAAEMTLVLGGDHQNMNLTAVFSRYNRLSPLYGKRTVGARIKYSLFVDTALGEVEYPQFVGEVRTISPSRANNTVEITALDLVEKLRKPVYLPQWAMYSLAANWGETDSQVAWSHGIIDLALRNCDVSPSGKRPTTRNEMNVPDDSLDGVQFFLPGNGTYVPAIGWVDNPRAMAFPNRGKAMYAPNGPVHPDVQDEALPTLGLKGVGPLNFTPSLPGGSNSPSWEGTLRYWCANRDRIPQNGTHWFGLTLNNPQQCYDIGSSMDGSEPLLQVMLPNDRYVMVNLSQRGTISVTRTNWRSGNVYETINTADYSWGNVPIPTDEGAVDVFVAFDFTAESGSRISIQVGSNDTEGWRSFGSPPVPNPVRNISQYRILGRVQVGQIVDMSDICYGARNMYNTDARNRDHLYRPAGSAAVLDRGLNRLSHIPSKSTAEAWEIIASSAGAEFGSVFWDEGGTFRFWNQETLVSKQQEPVRTLTIDYAEDLHLTDTLDSVRNVFIIEAKKRRAVDTSSVYSSDDEGEFETPARSTTRTTVWVDDIVSPLTFPLGRYGSQEWGGDSRQPRQFVDEVSHGYVVQGYWDYARNGWNPGWYEDNLAVAAVDASAYFNHQGQLVVRIWNGNNMPIRLAKGLAGQANDDGPAVNIAGTKVEDYPSQTFTVRNQSSINRYGEKALELTGDWYQDTYTTSNMVSTLMQRTADPIPVSDDITIPGDPRLQLADTVILQDAEGYGIDIPAQIIGIKREFSDNGLVDVLTIEVLRPYDGGIPTDPPEGETIERVNLSANPRLQNNENDWFSDRYESGRVANLNYFPEATTGYYATDHMVTPRANVESGQVYTYSIYAYPTRDMTITLTVDWYDSTKPIEQQYLSTGGSRSFRVRAYEPVRLSINATPPGRADQAPMVARYSGDVYWSQHLVERSATVLPYFDGDSNDSTEWVGETGNSVSVWHVQGSDDDDGGEVVTPPEEGGYTRHNLCSNPVFGSDEDELAKQTSGYYWPDIPVERVTGQTDMVRPTALSFGSAIPSSGGAITAPQTEDFAAGDTVTVSTYLRNDGLETLDGSLELHCRQADGTWNGSTGTTAFSIVPGTIVRVSITSTLPDLTTSFNPAITSASRAFTMTGWLYENTEVLRSYFDGGSEDSASVIYAWDAEPMYSTSTMVFGDGGSPDPGEPAPPNEENTAAAAFGWGEPVAWDDFNYLGMPREDQWSIYGEGGSQPHIVDGADGKQCWPGHESNPDNPDGNGRRCVEEVSLNGSYLRLAIRENGDQSGISHSYGQQYGRWEIRARTLPREGSTGFPGHSVLIVWPDSERWPQDGEYDFFEVDVGDTEPFAWIHYPHDPGIPNEQIGVDYDGEAGPIDVAEWHNYAIEWTPDHIKLFVDGIQWGPTMSGGANDIRRDIQDMPSGHLTMQIDNFNPEDVGMQEGYLDVDWVRIYDLSSGSDQPAGDMPEERAPWAFSQMLGNEAASVSLENLEAGDTIFAFGNTSGQPTVAADGVTFEEVTQSGNSVNVRMWRGVVGTAGTKTVRCSTSSTSGAFSAGAYVGDVRTAQVQASGSNGNLDLAAAGVSAPDNSLVLASWAMVQVNTTWLDSMGVPSSMELETRGAYDGGSPGTKTVSATGSQQYVSGAATGTLSAELASTPGDGTSIGWGAVVAAIVAT